MPLDFIQKFDPKTKEQCIETTLSGKPLLTTPQLNKGSAFTLNERRTFGLQGKLPPQVETLEQQMQRAYEQFQDYTTDFQRHIYLNNLHDTNQVLFYKLVLDQLDEMMPLIYTPHVGTAVKTFSQQFRQARGLYLTYPDRDEMQVMLNNRSNPEVDLIVVTDGEAVLGIGDQGIGAINIPIAKLMVYTLCGGINPTRTLPIMLDVGTNNQTLLQDPLYLGWRNPRIRGAEYQDFIGQFLSQINILFPDALLHWEDFGAINARNNLALCQNKICSFNDDMQGTGTVAIATIMAGLKSLKQKLVDQQIVIFGAGNAGIGIAEQLCQGFTRAGLSLEEARSHIWLVDRPGLLTTDAPSLNDYQRPYARPAAACKNYQRDAQGQIDLLETINQAKPAVLLGCSSASGAFNKAVVKQMLRYQTRPIILPLSNPTENAEAKPEDLIIWSDNNALVATGSPFPEINYKGQHIRIAQCNNSYIFPGLGLGAIAVKAKTISPGMLWQACEALSSHSPISKDPTQPLLPKVSETREVAREIGIAVAKQAIAEGLAKAPTADITALIDTLIWSPAYLPLIKK